MKNTQHWVMGNPKKLSEPQLWMDKDLFTPSRARFNAGSQLREVFFESYRYFKEVPIPRTITLANPESVPLIKEEVLEVAISSTGIAQPGPGRSAGAEEEFTGKLRKLVEDTYEFLR